MIEGYPILGTLTPYDFDYIYIYIYIYMYIYTQICLSSYAWNDMNWDDLPRWGWKERNHAMILTMWTKPWIFLLSYWDNDGFTMILFDFIGIIMGLTWDYHGIIMGLSWDTDGYTLW